MEPLDHSATTVMAFTEEQVSRLTGLTVRQLQYWRRTGFFEPSFGGDFYSFRDLVGLRVVAKLRKQVPLQELRKVYQWLRERSDSPWASLTFYLAGKVIYVEDPRSGRKETRRPRGQLAMSSFPMERIANETLSAVRADRSRDRTKVGHVSKTRGVASGQSVVAGTRIRTDAIWQFHNVGKTARQIQQQYPDLTIEDVLAAIEFEEKRRRIA